MPFYCLLWWWTRRRTSLDIFEVFSTRLEHAPTWARVPRVNNKPMTTSNSWQKKTTVCPDDLEALPIWYWGGTRSIWMLIKPAFHQVLVDLRRIFDGWVMVFPTKHCRLVDTPNVGFWWACTPRSILCILYPCPMCCRCYRKCLSQVYIIIIVVPKHIQSNNIRYKQIRTYVVVQI
jgi:hypothetical protein